MGSSCFIGTESSELSGKLIDDWLKTYRLARRLIGEPVYIIGIDYSWAEVKHQRIPFIIGDWT